MNVRGEREERGRMNVRGKREEVAQMILKMYHPDHAETPILNVQLVYSPKIENTYTYIDGT